MSFSERDRLFVHYARSASSNVNPLSVAGANVPGFPVGEDLSTHTVAVSETHVFSGSTVNDLRLGFFRNGFDTDKPLNRTPPRALGFNYGSTLSAAEGPPFFIVSGYASIGDPITGPRDTTQNTFQVHDALSHVTGAHSFGSGVDFRRNQINMTEGIASNGFFVFAPFPLSDSFASFLFGFPVVFFQAGGDMNRGLRNIDFAAYGQDEWRVTPRLTINYGLRWEVSTPFTDIRNRMNSWSPGKQSTVFPNAPAGLLFPGDKGVPDGIAPVYWKGLMPRVGLAWDPTGSGKTSIRAAYGIFYDSFTNGVGGPLQAPLSALPWTQARQLPPPIDFTDPWHGQYPFVRELLSPTDYRADSGKRDAAAVFAELEFLHPARVRQGLPGRCTVYREQGNAPSANDRSQSGGLPSGRHIGERRSAAALCRLPRPQGPCDFASVGLITNPPTPPITRRRRRCRGVSITGWRSWLPNLFEIAGLCFHVQRGRIGAAPGCRRKRPGAGSVQPEAEHGPSLFDARHRFVLSGSYEIPFRRTAQGLAHAALAGGS